MATLLIPKMNRTYIAPTANPSRFLRQVFPMNIVLLGQHITHSLSPVLHNHLFRQHHLPFVYGLFPVAAAELPSALEKMKQGGYAGANVTSPHKELVFNVMDELDPLADRVRSVNTVLFQDGKAIGYNTDVSGFRWSLEDVDCLPLRSLNVGGDADSPLRTRAADFTAAVLGTGGAARAAIHVLLSFPNLRQLTLYSRSQERADKEAFCWNDSRMISAAIEHLSPADILVNATPVGLNADVGLGQSHPLEKSAGNYRFFYDMIYRPAVTPLMAFAKRAGIPAMNGLRMFAGQAAESFRLWTGIMVDPAELHNLLQEHLKNQ